MSRTAVYPGTFDPFTLGHQDILTRAVRLFDRVVVGVAASAAKQPLFAQGERIALVEEAASDLPGVVVVAMEGLVVEFARTQGASAIIRGLRGPVDFDYEAQMAGCNARMAPEVETLFLAASPGVGHITATLVREIARMGGDYRPFVSAMVGEALAAKLG